MKVIIFYVLFLLGFSWIDGKEIYLQSEWIISNANGSIIMDQQRVPSGVYTALEEAGLTESVLDSFNDVALRWIAKENWNYLLKFDVPDAVNQSQFVILTFHGIDTLATVTLNGIQLGYTDNMFVRYRYDVSEILRKTNNILTVHIESPIHAAANLAKTVSYTPPECPPDVYHGECHMNLLRKMQASFSWDWGLAVPSMGLWRPVVLEYYNSAVIRDVTVKIVSSSSDETWDITVATYLEAGRGVREIVRGNLTVDIMDVIENEKKISIIGKTNELGEFKVETKLNVSKENIQLWWPNGYGKQKMYNLRVVWSGEEALITNRIPRGDSRLSTVTKIVKIGFRSVELIQEPIGTGLSFYFKINGIPIFMKGTNWIPMSIFPEESSNLKKMEYLLKSAKESHMNMIRVWGGGLYENDAFYDLADNYGILIWHDLLFACAMYPVFPAFLDSVKMEIIQNLRRIQRHPSVAIWAANNENEVALVQNWYNTGHEFERFSNEYRKLYIEVVKTTVEANDNWRICLSSSPSNGNKTESENWISKDPQDWNFGDIHYYNYDLDGWNPNYYPKPRFVSEYGFQSFPSYNAWKAVMKKDDNLTQLMDHRQHSPLRSHPIDHLVRKHLPLEKISTDQFEAYIYFSQISQAMTIKTETEVYRVERGSPMNTMGALYWQLNDIWVAPSWSSIEFNGQFKILHHWTKDFLAPIVIIAQVNDLKEVNIFVVRDTLGTSENYLVTMKIYQWNSLSVKATKDWNLNMESNSVSFVANVKFTEIFNNDIKQSSAFLYFELKQLDGNIISTNFILPEKLRNATGISDPFIDVSISSNRCTFSVSQISLVVKIRVPTIFVYLQLNNRNIGNYSLSKNGFIQVEPIQTIHLKFDNEDCKIDLSDRDIQVLTVNQFLIS